MKKNRILKISLLILLLAVITISVISGTLAKYTETVYGTDTARVAKFEYLAQVSGTSITSTNVAEPTQINLFNTQNDTEVYGDGINKNGDDKLIAPGTCGSFDVIATNKSEVDVSVTYNITETNAGNVPIVYFVQDSSGNVKYYSNEVTTATAVALGSDVATHITQGTSTTVTADTQVTIEGNLSKMAEDISTTLAATNKTTATTSTSTVGWFWAFGDATHNVDGADTTLGKAGTASVIVNIGVVFTQVD